MANILTKAYTKLLLNLYMKNRKPRQDGRYYVGVSFLETETDLLDHADMYGNFSVYVKNLIRADMNKSKSKKEEPATESEMFKMLMAMMGSSQLKDIFQKNQEVSVDAVEPQKEQKPKLNKKAINNFIKK